MRRGLTLTALTGALALAGAGALRAALAPNQAEAVVGKRVATLRLPDTSGKVRTAGEFQKAKVLVVAFLGTDCPVSNSYAEQLTALQTRYGPRGVQLLGVNADPAESLERLARHSKEYRLSFPVLHDARQELADLLGARVTPEVFVLDSGRKVRYRGRIDDGYASRTRKRSEVSSPDLENAIEAVLAGKPVSTTVTTALGCAIPRPEKVAATGSVTYHKDVAPILQERCQSCHRPGQVAPFSLLTYADAKSWAQEIKTFTASRQMPPWKAEPGHGEFMDVRRLSDDEIKTLTAWVEGGAPQGSPKDGPAPKQWPDGWMLGKPDLVLTMPEPFHVSASGDDVFQVFVLPTNLTEDKQIVAYEVRPGNARVLHHVVSFLDTSGKARELDAKDPAPGYNSGPGGVGFMARLVNGWAPGNFPRYLPEGSGRRLPKGSDLVIQCHYHKTGKPETDQTSIGLYFAKTPVQRQVNTMILGPFDINIPPGAARHPVSATFPIPADVSVIGVLPHMHLLGKEIKVSITLPDGKEQSLVWIKDWDYRWQDTYRFKEPLRVPKGSKLTVSGIFDNTADNPLNPNKPPKRVTFGEQTTDEMCFALLDYSVDAPVGLLQRLRDEKK